jgi:hypothetical protein
MMDPKETMRLPQGDVGLLRAPAAQEMLQSKEPARVAYIGPDELPRVVTMQFHWTGDELVLTSIASLPKVRALREHPDVAITIDTFAIAIRGRASVTEVEGVVPEAYLANCRYIGKEAADGWAQWISQQGTKVARIAVRPRWVSLLDYQTRFPQGWPDHLRP